MNAILPVTEVTRVIPAPRSRVFQAWIEPDLLKNWFSGEGFTIPEAEVDARVGGAFLVVLLSGAGHKFLSHGHYVEFLEPQRLVSDSAMTLGGVKRFSAHTVALFEDGGDATKLSIRQTYTVHDNAYLLAIEAAPFGWRSSLNKLEKLLASTALS